MPQVAGAPATTDTTNDIVVKYRGKQISFAPFGGSLEAKLKTGVFYESEMLEYIEALGLAGTYVDVGGYVGTHALFFATYCPADDVHTFEPRATCYQHLSRNIAANALSPRVKAHRMGLSDRDESFDLTMGGKTEQIECHPLDHLIQTPVSLMKIDVEGMEPRVLAGASRILAAHKPLLFIEAHTDDELGAILNVLAPYGYRATGRVFNQSPTYELAAPDSPTAGERRLPQSRDLLHRDAWHPEPGIDVEWKSTRLVLRSDLAHGKRAHVTQLPIKLRHPPATSLIANPTTPCFIQMRCSRSAGLKASVYVMAYSSGPTGFERTAVVRHRAHSRLVGKLELPAGTQHVRVAIRIDGPGTLEIDDLRLHTIAT